jgi:large subunit ribosomal protein L25
MKKLVLVGTKRVENAKKSRKNGFIPGVVYGKNSQTIPVKFKEVEFINFLKVKGEKSKILISIDNEENLGIIKEVSRDLVTNKIAHVDIQLVKRNELVNWTIPIVYTGRSSLKTKGLYLQMYLSEVEVAGEAAKIPDIIKLDVSAKDFGDNIKVKDLGLNSEIRTMKETEEIIATVTV